jgi:hypothetical protein
MVDGAMRRIMAWVALLFATGAWLTRYQYVTTGARVVRVQRWTGSASVLTARGWQPVRESAAAPPASGGDDGIAARRVPALADSTARYSGSRIPSDSLKSVMPARGDVDPYSDLTDSHRVVATPK